jgi:hypothetical protein
MDNLHYLPTLWEMPNINTKPLDMLSCHREWLAQLSATERTIFDTAYALYNTLTVPGGCYHNSFFLHYHLKKRYGIQGTLKVGFIQNVTTQRYASHAWYVYKSTITDLAVSRPFNPSRNPIGPLTILGRTIIDGSQWHYYDERSPEGFVAAKELLTCPSADPYDMVSQAKHTHITISKMAESTSEPVE